jgi:hypothetical protein
MLKANKTLVAKKPLKAKSTLKAKARPKKQKLPTITALRKKADALFGHYIRLRDAELVGGISWQGQCISSDKVYTVRYYDEDAKKWKWGRDTNIGHFVGRGNLCLRYDEMNCNMQSVRDNKWKSGNNAAYHKAIDLKYGDGTAQQLIDFAHNNKNFKLKREDLENVIKACNEYLEWCYSQERQLHDQEAR